MLSPMFRAGSAVNLIQVAAFARTIAPRSQEYGRNKPNGRIELGGFLRLRLRLRRLIEHGLAQQGQAVVRREPISAIHIEASSNGSDTSA